jgi:hypothetical protein
VLVVHPGRAAFHEHHGSIEGEAETGGRGAEPVGLGVTIDQDRRDRGSAAGLAVEVGPAELGFRAQHPRADLVIDADLRAAEEPADRVLIFASALRAREGCLLQAPAGAGVDAEVEAGPAEQRCRRRSLVGRARQVRRIRRSGEDQSCKRDADECFDHDEAPLNLFR